MPEDRVKVTPKRYRAEFIEPGIVSYEDAKAGITLIQREALDKMRKTFIGKPVFNFEHKLIPAEEAFDFKNLTQEELDKMADGIVSDVGYNEKTGWDWADLLIWDDETQKSIDENGFNVSCAYIPSDTADGGTYHNMNYDSEVLDGEYIHMAIVENPRYEGSTIYANSKQGGKKPMADKKPKWSFFAKKNSIDPEKPEKKEEEKKPPMENEGEIDGYVEIDGKEVPLEELVEDYIGKMQNTSENKIIPDDTEISLPNGEKVTVGQMKASYGPASVNEVIEPSGKESEPEKDTVVKENAKKGKEEPNEHFKGVKQNAVKYTQAVSVSTKEDRLKAGSEKYGGKA